jgi:hypothetical protein
VRALLIAVFAQASQWYDPLIVLLFGIFFFWGFCVFIVRSLSLFAVVRHLA